MKIAGAVGSYPARALAFWHLTFIVLGTFVLLHPRCHAVDARPLSVVDAVFTSTSATCVTGLVVRSTEHDFSIWGQAVILLLIQIGGIGVMTLSSYVVFTVGKAPSIRDHAVLSSTVGAERVVDIKRLLRRALLYTFLIEAIGVLVLTGRNLWIGFPPRHAVWHATFHTISAFCNAGFALQDTSLMGEQFDVVVNVVVVSLIVLGGIGFPVLIDVTQNLRHGWRDGWERLNVHSKCMLIGSGGLLLFGMLAFLLLEADNTLRGMPVGNRLLLAGFHSATCRTAGFNTVPIDSLTNATLFVSLILMAIGAGPGSTAGGFKVSTLTILALRAWTSLRGRAKVHAFRRTLPDETVTKAFVTILLFAAVGVVALTLLLVCEQSHQSHLTSGGNFLDASFEVISALGTVGLSTGLTARLTTVGRLIIIALMFIGRLGPITVFAALSLSEQKSTIEYPREGPLLG